MNQLIEIQFGERTRVKIKFTWGIQSESVVMGEIVKT